MPVLNAGGRNSDQKNQLNSIPNTQVVIPETPLPPNTFHFWNGDEYNGQFAIIIDKQKIIMQGMGIYKTSDGHTYEGLWENDCLKEKCKVTFPAKVVFSGDLDEMVIEGFGKYTLMGKMELEGFFVRNGLTGEVQLKDPNNHKWKGKVGKDGICVDFYPLHAFWQSVLNLPSKAPQVFYGEAEEENENDWEGF